jgi:hypothetical protein
LNSDTNSVISNLDAIVISFGFELADIADCLKGFSTFYFFNGSFNSLKISARLTGSVVSPSAIARSSPISSIASAIRSVLGTAQVEQF